MAVCGEADNAIDALSEVARLGPDAVIVDIGLPGTNGIEFLKNMRAQFPDLPAVVLSMHDESVYAQRALRAGALGYVMKKENPEEIVVALRKALAGEFHVSGKVTGAIFHQAIGLEANGKSAPPSPVAQLSDRELEVFALLGRGRSTRAIADELRVSPKTIESHRAHIKEKLGLATSNEMVQHAALWVNHDRGGEPGG